MRRDLASAVVFAGAPLLAIASAAGCGWILGVDKNWELADASTADEGAVGDASSDVLVAPSVVDAEADGTDTMVGGNPPDATSDTALPQDAGATDAEHGTDGRTGCVTSNDCPNGQACNATGQCGTSCAGGLVCHGGCCPPSGTPTCQPGTASNACGTNGGACATCNGGCAGGLCTCTSYTQCPLLQACGAMGQCSSSCAGGLKCNFGCCDRNGTCVNGLSNSNACGLGTTQCKTCTGATPTCDAGVCI